MIRFRYKLIKEKLEKARDQAENTEFKELWERKIKAVSGETKTITVQVSTPEQFKKIILPESNVISPTLDGFLFIGNFTGVTSSLYLFCFLFILEPYHLLFHL